MKLMATGLIVSLCLMFMALYNSCDQSLIGAIVGGFVILPFSIYIGIKAITKQILDNDVFAIEIKRLFYI